MLEQEKKAVCWKNGEFEEYLVTTGFSWETLESVTAKTDRNTVAEIGRLYRLGILPKHPFLARQVILGSLSGDEEIPYPKETPEGTILDRRMLFQYWARRFFREGKLTAHDGQVDAVGPIASPLARLLGRSPFVTEAGKGKDTLSFVLSPQFVRLGEDRSGRTLVNAHFFLMEPADCSTPWDLLGQPFGLLVLRGGILQPPLFGRGSLMVMKDGSAHIGHPSLKDLGILVGDRLFQAGQNAVVYERPRYAFSPADSGAYDMAIVNDAVVALKQGGGLEVPQAGFVLRSGEAVKGGTVSYTGMEDVLFAIQIGPVLVEDGNVKEGFDTPMYEGRGIAYPPTSYPLDWVHDRAPRVALGSKAGKPVLIWASGTNRFFYREGESPCGASLAEFAAFCRDEGLDTCVNLDGGGSAQVVCNGKRRLRLSDRSDDLAEAERPVPLGLALTRAVSQTGT